jgi:hypothetical protein
MMELLSKFDADGLVGLTAVVGGLLCGALGIVMGVGLAIRKSELDAGLKRSMIERGMSAEEICMVMGARSSASRERAKQPAYREV